MEKIETKNVEVDGMSYEINVFRDENGFIVKAFKDGKRANGYVYSVSFETNEYYLFDNGIYAYAHLMEMAESDIRSHMWDKCLQARKEKNLTTAST
ncbi:hypothetical protein K7J14_14780 [Treponema zuelzerae]|uniref:Uncharacterized protein n=1 Tax=Teretinema zuelzerae TaxID=156 RepID=A0AAE3JJ36_9SPIR|nr:hypothetical protein [Teretinema zuelzerae]MCD1655951.1 hypothetical protein [Teretinema zuelzerae]MCD1655962.1 hypothetical protein [Teretinema zuelzerae]